MLLEEIVIFIRVKFNPEDLNYYLKDLGHGFWTFIKILDWIEIKNNYLLNIGDNYLVFSIGLENGNAINENYIIKNNNIENGSILNVKIFSSNSKNKKFSIYSFWFSLYYWKKIRKCNIYWR